MSHPMMTRSRMPSRFPQATKRRAATLGESTTLSKRARTSTKGDGSSQSKPRRPEDPEASQKLSEKKWKTWSQHSDTSPYPSFTSPTRKECYMAHGILEDLHGDKVRENFHEPDAPVQDMEYSCVMGALVVAALSQATSWANAKRAMNSMKEVYGSTFAYGAIMEGGADKLRDALRPGGMQNRKSKILMGLLEDVKARHGQWDLQHLMDMSDEEVVKEVVSYWGLSPKCAHCLLSICLNRTRFAVDTHIFRISGLWGWRPRDASVQNAQAHLNARIPDELKFSLHYQLIVHGRECSSCRGNGTSVLSNCDFWKRFALEQKSTAS